MPLVFGDDKGSRTIGNVIRSGLNPRRPAEKDHDEQSQEHADLSIYSQFHRHDDRYHREAGPKADPVDAVEVGQS